MWDRRRTDLVEVGEAVWVLAESLVLSSYSISCCYFPELLQVDHIQSTAGSMTATRQTCMCEKYNFPVWADESLRTWCGICALPGGSPSNRTSRSGSHPSPSGSRRTECNRTAPPPGRSHAAPSGLFAQSEVEQEEAEEMEQSINLLSFQKIMFLCSSNCPKLCLSMKVSTFKKLINFMK